MVGKDFYFNGKSLSDFGFVMVAADNTDNSGMQREILKGSMNAHRAEANHYGTKYTDPIILYFKVINNMCVVGEDTDEISYQRLREFQAWLTSKTVPYPLMMEFEEGEPTEYIGVFSDVQPVVQRGLNGITFTFTCNSPFAYVTQGLVSKCEDNQPDPDETMKARVDSAQVGYARVGNAGYDWDSDYGEERTTFCDTDELDYVYPVVELSNMIGGEFTICNESDDNQEMTFTLDSSYDKYVIDCKLKRIMADGEIKTLDEMGWNIENLTDYNDVNTGIYKAYWLRIVPGLNKLKIAGGADCKITYKTPIKIGGYVDV